MPSEPCYFFVLCFLALQGHQQSRSWLHARFIMHSLSCINKFGKIPNCIFCSTCVCIHFAEPNSKSVSYVHTFAGLQKSICAMYLPHLLTCMLGLNNFVFFQLGPTMKRLPKKSFHSSDITRCEIYKIFPYALSCMWPHTSQHSLVLVQ